VRRSQNFCGDLQTTALSLKIKRGTQGDGRVAIAFTIMVLMLLTALVLFGFLVVGLFRPEIYNLISFGKSTAARNQVNPELKRRLLMLCNGNEALAKRLVAHARDYNRQRSANWWYEKAIADLERDRYGR
jgi:hypothetical protein